MNLKRNIGLLIGGTVLAIGVSGCSKSYDDCILENIENAQTRIAVFDIRRACEKKYKKNAQTRYTLLPQSQQNAEEFLDAN